jgi:hypothetical protein
VTDIAKSHQEHVADAIAHELAARWYEASKSWAAARRASGAETPELKPGTVLEHKARGKVTATCLYEGPDAWVFDGTTYGSAYAAANAAARALGHKTTADYGGRGGPSGWHFWGLKKRWEGARKEWRAGEEETET